MRADKTVMPNGGGPGGPDRAGGADDAGGAGGAGGAWRQRWTSGGWPFRRVLGVLARAAALVGVFALGQLALPHLLGDPGPGPDPDIGGSLMVLVAVALTAAVGASVQARRQGFGPAVQAWGPAIAVLALVGIADVVRTWLADRASGIPAVAADGAMELLAPMAALAVVGGGILAATFLGAAAGDALRRRRGVWAG